MSAGSGHHPPQDNNHHHQYHDQNHHQKHPQQLPEEIKANEQTIVHPQMFLTLSSNTPFLFKNWSLQTIEGLVFALILTMVIAMVHEAVVHSLYIGGKCPRGPRSCSTTSISLRLGLTFLHTLHIGLAYILMLCVMTFNVWLLVTVALGAGLGYFLFRPLLQWVHSLRTSSGATDSHNITQVELQKNTNNGTSCKNVRKGTCSSKSILDSYAVTKSENTELLQTSNAYSDNEQQRTENEREEEPQHLQPLLTKRDQCCVNVQSDSLIGETNIKSARTN